jgi:hypothetical protein
MLKLKNNHSLQINLALLQLNLLENQGYKLYLSFAKKCIPVLTFIISSKEIAKINFTFLVNIIVRYVVPTFLEDILRHMMARVCFYQNLGMLFCWDEHHVAWYRS